MLPLDEMVVDECREQVVRGGEGVNVAGEVEVDVLHYVNVSSSMGTPKVVMLEQLAWFAREVMPKFRPPGA
jgi:hypothetical protein